MDAIGSSTTGNRAQIESCIEAFVEETAYVPAAARPVLDPGELSPRLERLTGTLAPTSAWRAWTTGPRGWFVQGQLAETADDGAGGPTVYMTFLDQDALPVTAGIWRRSVRAHWDLLQLFPRVVAESARR